MIFTRHQIFASCYFVAIFVAINAQVSISVEPARTDYEQNDTVIVSCTYTYDPSAVFLSSQWLFGESTIMASYAGSMLTYPSPDYQPPAYSMSEEGIENGSNFTITSAAINDSGIYTCRIRVFMGDSLSFEDKENITIHKNATTFEGQSGGSDHTLGDPLTVTAGEEITITLKVPDIFPAAQFSWKVGSRKLTESTTNTKNNGLFTSTSTATLSPTIDDNNKQVTCVVSIGGEFSAKVVIAILDVQGKGGCALARLDPRLVLVSLAWIVANQIAAHF